MSTMARTRSCRRAIPVRRRRRRMMMSHTSMVITVIQISIPLSPLVEMSYASLTTHMRVVTMRVTARTREHNRCVVLLVWRLTHTRAAYSRSVGSVARTHISRRAVSRQSVGVLLDICRPLLGFALPELALGLAGGVAVVGVVVVLDGLLLLAVADEAILDEDGEEEEDGSNDRNSKSRLLQSTRRPQARQSSQPAPAITRSDNQSSHIPTPKRGAHNARARMRPLPCRIRKIDKGAGEAQIEQHAEHAEEGDAAEEADEDERDEGVEGGGAGDALDGLDGRVDVQAVRVLDGDVVGEDPEDDDGAAELDDSQEPRERLERETFRHLDGGGGGKGWCCGRIGDGCWRGKG